MFRSSSGAFRSVPETWSSVMPTVSSFCLRSRWILSCLKLRSGEIENVQRCLAFATAKRRLPCSAFSSWSGPPKGVGHVARVFVTGGSGFIGQVLVRRLLAEEHSVRVLVRSGASADKVAMLGAEPVHGVLTDSSSWRDAATGCDVMFHLAAETDIEAVRARHDLVTARGTQAALAAASHAGVPRFVHCGSEAALLAGDPLVDVDETAPLRPDSEAAYCAAKAGAERMVLDANGPNLATVSIRPRFVWAPTASSPTAS